MVVKHTFHYLTITQEIKSRNLYVLGGGTTVVPAHERYPPSDHPQHHFFSWTAGRVLTEYQLVYITRGGGILESTSAGSRNIVSGDLFMLFPGEWHRYSPDEISGWDEHWVAFQGRRVPSIIDELGITLDSPVFRTDITHMLEREFVRIEEELSGEAPGYQSIVTARIELILALAATSGLRENLGTLDTLQVIKKAKTLIIERIDQPVYMEDVAKELNLGYSWFRKTFRTVAGISPGEYQLQIRIVRACEFLRGSALPITEIGTRCGFESAYYFSRIFKKKVGFSPSDYRTNSKSSAVTSISPPI